MRPAQPLNGLQSHPREFWALPSQSQVISWSSWGPDGRRAEIHRCFSLLGRGKGGYAGQVKVAQSRVREPELGELELGPDVRGYKQGTNPTAPTSGRRRLPDRGARRLAPPAGIQALLWPPSLALCLCGYSGGPRSGVAYSVRALSSSWCLARCPCSSLSRNTWPGMPWSFRLRSRTCSSAMLAWTKTANFPSLEKRRRGREGHQGSGATLRATSRPCEPGGGRRKTCLRFQAWLHWAPVPSWQ